MSKKEVETNRTITMHIEINAEKIEDIGGYVNQEDGFIRIEIPTKSIDFMSTEELLSESFDKTDVGRIMDFIYETAKFAAIKKFMR